MAVQSQIYADFSSVGMPFNELIHQQQQQNQFLVNHQQLQSLQSLQEQSQFVPSEINKNNNFVFSAMRNKPTNISMAFSDVVTRQFENQRVEIDKYINLQNERLKLALRELRKQQLTSFVRKLELRVAMVIRQKDEEISKARNRLMDLQEYMKRMEMENLGWRRIAGENEAMIANLNATIEQLREKAAIRLQQQKNSNNCDVEDAESCCDVSFEEEGKTEEVAEETGERNSKRKKMMMVCKRCNYGDSSVLLLPCRHLCCCKACEAFLYACPVCNSAKEGSIDALFF
ncbi:hypothetical protein V2J09_015534 [Rumex salicifolius]